MIDIPYYRIQHHEVDSHETGDSYFNIDMDLYSIEVNAHDHQNKFRPPFWPNIPKETWTSLTTDEQAAWDTLSSSSKAAILEVNSSSVQ